MRILRFLIVVATVFSMAASVTAQQLNQLDSDEQRATGTATISGIVYAEDGDPVSGAKVEAQCVDGPKESGSAQRTTAATTDDLGAFRLFDLPAGHYVVNVSLANPAETSEGGPLSTIVYPSRPGRGVERTLELGPGTALSGLSITLPGEHMPAIVPQSEAQSSVQGTVMNLANDSPIPNARVELKGEGNGRPTNLTTRTGADGTFTFQQVPKGSYRVVANHTGFLALLPTVPAPSPHVKVKEDRETVSVSLRLVPQGVIAGRVFEEGTPVKLAIVTLMRLAFDRGQRRLVSVKYAYTDDLGQYRLFDLAPGHYFVSAADRSVRGALDRADEHHGKTVDKSDHEKFVPTFFPAAASFRDAVPIEIKPGSSQTSTDISLFRMHGWFVSGKVQFPRDPIFLEPPWVELRPSDPMVSNSSSQRIATVNTDDGTFRIDNVLQGSYLLAVNTQIAGSQFFGTASVDVSGSNVQGVPILIRPGFSLHGRITVADGGRCEMSELRVIAQSLGDTGAVQSISAAVMDDGAFVFENLHPDRFRIDLSESNGSCYLKSVILDSHEVRPVSVQLATESPLQLVLSPNGGRIDGVTIDNSQTPRPAKVLLVPPPELRDRTDLFKTAVTDESGRFSLQGIAPGEYKLLGLNSLFQDTYFDSEVLAPLEQAAQSVTMIEAGGVTVRLKIVGEYPK
jgi:hypothetical protein